LEEIIVTATKRQESIQQIPISVTAITEKMLEDKSALNFTDYARGVPNLSFIDVGVGRERVAIRGVDSKTGTTTVGYYFDETPIPDSSSVSAVKVAFDPELIDVNRVEVLRGPQGTVFGSGSMGGTIRVIPNAPDVKQSGFSVKTRVSSTEHANGPSETFSGMLNIPLIADKLAVRLVAFGQWESGFIDRQIATTESHAANVATGAPLDFQPAGTVPSGEAFGGRIALRYQVNDALALEASIFSESQFYRGFQDITTGDQNPNDALVQNFLFNLQEENRNRLTINNLKGTADLGWGDLLVSASYTRRLLSLKEETAAALEFVGFAPAFNAAPITEEGRDNSATVEARLSSSRSGPHANDPLQWLIGAYYAYQKGWTVVPWIVPGFTDHFGALTGPVAGDNLYNSTAIAWIRQKAIFGELTYSPVERLKVTIGSRWFDYSRTDSTPQNGLFAGINSAAPLDPYNYPTVVGTANSAVYKGSVSWQHTKNLMVYAQASEGFRGPFGRAALPDTCTAEAEKLGAGIGAGQVGSDQLWNYEVGIKSDWLSNRLRINVSAFRINWTNVQQAVFLLCGFDLTENLGSVRNDGGEVEIEGRITEAFSAGTSIGYVHSALQQDIYGIPGTKGQPLPDVPQMTVGAYLEYNFPGFQSWRPSVRTDYSYSDESLSAYGVGVPFTPDKKAISMLNARLSLQRDNLELAFYAQNLFDDVQRTALERDVSLNVATRLRYSVNTPRTFGIGFTYKR
jgi:outer membrane receptor protein involved in Fe transport